jgi:hypothetical protein
VLVSRELQAKSAHVLIPNEVLTAVGAAGRSEEGGEDIGGADEFALVGAD